MKSKIGLLLLIIISKQVSGQLQLNAGNDTILCTSPWDTTEIGGHPSAWGGQEPYTYTWSTNVQVGSQNWGASHFLDDTTKANPKLANASSKDLRIKLEVKDNSGALMEDFINVRFSRFYSLAMDFYANIIQGDTIYLAHDIVGGISPLKFAWSPNYNISDTSISSPMAWPYVDTWYKVIAIDSTGCVSQTSYFDIRIRSSGILQSTEYQSTLFPNPIDNSSAIYYDAHSHTNLILEVMDLNGKMVFSDRYLHDSYRIGEIISRSGTYYYFIRNDLKVLTGGKFIKP